MEDFDQEELENALKSPLDYPLKRWVRLLNSPKLWIWELKGKENTLEYSSMIFLACVVHIHKAQMAPKYSSLKQLTRRSSDIFKLLDINVPVDPIRILIELVLKWGDIENFSKIKQKQSYLSEWVQFSSLFCQNDKILMYTNSKFYCDIFKILLYLFYYVGMYCMINSKSKKGDVRLHSTLFLVTKLFNKVFNHIYQFPTYMSNNFVKCWFDEDNIDCSDTIKKFDILFDSFKDDSKYLFFARNFFVCYIYEISIIEHEQWKVKDYVIKSYIWELLGIEVPLMVERILKKKDQYDTLNCLKYINLKGWMTGMWDDIKEKKKGKQLTYVESLFVLSIAIFWMKNRAAFKQWEDCFLVLYNDSKYSKYYKNVLTCYPRFIDCSRNEWGIIYERTIQKGGIFACIHNWCQIIKQKKGSRIPKNLREDDFASIRLFIAPSEQFALKYKDTTGLKDVTNDNFIYDNTLKSNDDNDDDDDNDKQQKEVVDEFAYLY